MSRISHFRNLTCKGLVKSSAQPAQEVKPAQTVVKEVEKPVTKKTSVVNEDQVQKMIHASTASKKAENEEKPEK